MTDAQTVGFRALCILTMWNMVMAASMMSGFPIYFGMPIAFMGMGVIVFWTWRLLMGNKRPWK